MDNFSDDNSIDPQIYKQLLAGKYLLNIRKSLGSKHTLKYVSNELGITHPYLIDIEKGLKVPSDALMSKIAKFYNISEDELFQRYGKVPIIAQKEILESKSLQGTLAQIGRNKKLSDDEKEELYEKIYETYLEFVNKVDSEKEGK